mmetsp:Transcript_28665/g.45144  ORF Transcript_28665/g.45144 Transcript_28665/m.45144 type:complete len:211 (+) Transcript_28665:83-715(+)
MMHQTALSFLRRHASTAALLMAAVLLSSGSTTSAFQIQSPISNSNHNNRPTSTTLFLEDHIANMIDNEMRRLYQKHETQSQWEARQRSLKTDNMMQTTLLPENYDFAAEEFEYVEPPAATTVVNGFTSGVDRSVSGPRRRKDEKMVEDDPMRYCADRCVSTGNCDVFEDMFEMGPEEVIKFCTECVLSEDEEPCDVPANLFDDGDDVLHP